MRYLLVLVALIVVVSCVLILVRSWTSSRPAVPARESPKEILKRRYAAGEIDEDEYLRRMSGLSQDW
ncbi:SHOCT domain-containing protein [Sphaerisporangium fuscum]|uniref:SHOCT domain-containing protein n=1 Tax=Sphaerisporangium fuscum TaxID=2835868 RepID=UPI001BDC9A6C|nr:SHOCT domain-containing protein [Sphaerisporangium fuscum]